jgi:acetolactate synthase-1/2/3 large subunit
MLDLHNPTLDWGKLAEGMGVEAVRVNDTRRFAAALRSAADGKGPRLIEALV